MAKKLIKSGMIPSFSLDNEGSRLIDALESATIKGIDDGCVIEELLSKEYEKALKAAGFDLNHIYLINGDRYKTKAPIQICRKRRIDVLRALYAYFYGSHNMTLEEVYEAAITEYGELVSKGHREQNTLEHYKNAWKKYISVSGIADMKISEIRHKHLFKFYSDITADGAITRSTLRNVKTTLNYCFDYAVQNDYIDTNIALSVKTDKLVCAPAKSHDGYTREEKRALRNVIESIDSPYARIIRLDFCLTVRIGELEALKWEDVDLNEGSLLIHSQIVIKTVNGIRKQVYVPYTKSNKYDNGHGKRRLKLNSKAVEVLKEQRNANPFGEYVFVSKNGTPLWTNKINEHLKEFCEAAGIEYRSSHSIRVTGITSLYDIGEKPTKIQVLAGHSDISTTNGYCRSEICDEISLDILERAL
ncbi:MAG: site-specific integrase [Lachnospiraceae bacterium]|nr:site-specific integrase [Lachnospiraceae bacterium]